MRKIKSNTEQILARIRDLRPGEHLCAIHENKSQQLAAAAAFIKGGLERGECLYIADGGRPDAIVTILRSHGIDVEVVRSAGRLTISDKREYLRNGRFDPDEMIRFLAESYRDAVSKYSGFRFGGEMTWILGGGLEVERLIEYEAKLNDFTRRRRTSILCQYFRPNFDDETILNVLHTHPLVIHQQFMAENPYYIPPREFFGKNVVRLQVERYLKALRDHALAKDQLRRLSFELLRSGDEERRRVARELHDSTGQILSGIVMNLASLLKDKENIDGRVRRKLRMCLKLAKQAARETNNISYLLHPPMLDEFGLSDALRWYVRGFASRSGMKVKLTIGNNLPRLSKGIELAIFRIVQEGLTNVRRHSGSRRAHVAVGVEGTNVLIKVQDFGRGLNQRSQPLDTVGVGIAGMRERLQQLGGELVIHSGSGGTILRGSLPAEGSAA